MNSKDTPLSGAPVLLTGGEGFIGSWLRDTLISQGAKLTLLVRDSHPRLNFFEDNSAERIENIVLAPLENRSAVERVILEEEIQFCFHLAAQSLVNRGQLSPRSTFVTNIVGTLNILEAARKSETIQGLIIASTDKAYGEPKKLPITEEHPLDPRYVYESSKACADIISRTYFQSYGLPVAVARCANTYGGRDLSYSRIVPSVIRSLLRRRQPIIESDGTPVRDYVYISDTVDAYLAIGKAITNSSVKGQAFNFGTGKQTTVREIVSGIIRLFGGGLEPIYLNKPGGIQKQYLSFEKAKETLGWKPRVDLEEGLRRTIEWYRRYSEHLM